MSSSEGNPGFEENAQRYLKMILRKETIKN